MWGGDPVNFVDPSGLKPGDSYKTRKGAVLNVLESINPTSIKESREYCGWICKTKSGKYKATKPKKGDLDGCMLPDKPENATDWYHTHGDADPDYDHENFSDASPGDPNGDIPASKYYERDGWLGTPWGVVKKYEFKTGKITTEGTIGVK